MLETIGTFEGEDILEATLTSEAGAVAKIMNWGAVLRDLQVPLADGGLQRVVLGFPRFEDYPAHSPNFGAIAGRYANRIAHGHLAVDGIEYRLPLNNGRHHLHGGPKGFGKRPWKVVSATARAVTLACVSEAGDAGFPGTLTTLCTYALEEPATLAVTLSATTDAATVVNLAHHSYFNLDGAPDIAGHVLQIEADAYTPVDTESIPSGEIALVGGTRFDFRHERRIGLMHDGQPSLYDHNFVLRKHRGPFARIARLASHANGLAMEVWSTESGVQLYDGHKVSTPVPGLSGAPYGSRAGVCLEPQFFPDTPNRPWFGDCVLRPGETYRQRTEYRFSAG